MRTQVFTKHFWFSFFACSAGFILASMPLTWSAMRIDLFPYQVQNQPDVPLIFGIMQFKYSTLAHLVGETLLCGIGLGVAASLNWLETRFSGPKLGSIAGCFAIFSGLGAVCAIVLFIGIVEVKIKPTTVNEDYIKYLQSAYLIFAGILAGYFGTILQVRRVVDLRNDNG